MSHLPLKGIRVIEFEGLAPTVFCGMMLADFGADVVIVNRVVSSTIGQDTSEAILNRGKRSIAVDLKNPTHRKAVKQLIEKADVVIDSFRPGKLENLQLGPQDIVNPGIIFARLTGFGQKGRLKDKAGHDINYLSYSGFLSTLGNLGSPPVPPNNILADFGGGGAFGVLGILLALFERQKTGKGQVVDISMTDSVSYLSSFLLNLKKTGRWNKARGQNMLDGSQAPFYRSYECKDGKYLAVGCIEPEFFKLFLKGIGIEYSLVDQFDVENYDRMTVLFQEKLLQKTRNEWMDIFLPLDCCVSPVLDFDELQTNSITSQFSNRIPDEDSTSNAYSFTFTKQPILSNHEPKLSQTKSIPLRGQHNVEVLREIGIPENQITQIFSNTYPKL